MATNNLENYYLLEFRFVLAKLSKNVKIANFLTSPVEWISGRIRQLHVLQTTLLSIPHHLRKRLLPIYFNIRWKGQGFLLKKFAEERRRPTIEIIALIAAILAVTDDILRISVDIIDSKNREHYKDDENDD